MLACVVSYLQYVSSVLRDIEADHLRSVFSFEFEGIGMLALRVWEWYLVTACKHTGGVMDLLEAKLVSYNGKHVASISQSHKRRRYAGPKSVQIIHDNSSSHSRSHPRYLYSLVRQLSLPWPLPPT
jgi:hypothetical protein